MRKIYLKKADHKNENINYVLPQFWDGLSDMKWEFKEETKYIIGCIGFDENEKILLDYNFGVSYTPWENDSLTIPNWRLLESLNSFKNP